MKILIVDDKKFIHDLLHDILLVKEIETLHALDGMQAKKLFKEFSSEINHIILDLNMPDFTGVEIIEEFKKIKKNVKILICSGFISDKKVKELTRKGIAGILFKPFRNEDLYDFINVI